MAAVFPAVRRDPIEPLNTLLTASLDPVSAARLRDARESLPPELRGLGNEVAGELGPRLPGGEIYTDDRAPVEWLIDLSILGYANEK
jgi:hypothetical protein